MKQSLFTLWLKLLRYSWFHYFMRYLSIGSSFDTKKIIIVMPQERASGWILDAICHEVANSMGQSAQLQRIDSGLSKAPVYFFSHYMFFLKQLFPLSVLYKAKSYIFFTHFESERHGISDKDLADILNKATGIICMNTKAKRELIELGMDEKKCHVVVGGSDPNTFLPHQREKDGFIGLSQSYYERKNPDLLLELVKMMPHRKFLLLGKNWHEYEHFLDLSEQENFKYVEAPYKNYPYWYSQMTVFLSVSHIEGGPIPLLEAMMSNVIPVVSNTGFAADIIFNGKNGFIFDENSHVEEVSKLIERAYEFDIDVSTTVSNYTWNNFSTNIFNIINSEKNL